MADDGALPGHPSLVPPPGGRDIGDYTVRDFALRWLGQQVDLPDFGRYRAENALLASRDDPRPRIVLIGDSITDFWTTVADVAPQCALINRGIAGQTSTQMLLRFQDDAIALAPRAIALLCGTNDLKAFVGTPADAAPWALAQITRNVTAMADMAAGRGIPVLIGTIPPVGAQENYRDPAAIGRANVWLRDLADRRGYGLIDYHRALADPDGHLDAVCSDDGVHPNAAGYARMAPVLRAALDTLLSSPLHRHTEAS